LYFIKNINISKLKYAVMVVVAYILVYTKASQIILNFIIYWIPRYSKYYDHSFFFKEDINLLSLGVLLNVVFMFYVLLVARVKGRYIIDVNYYLIGTVI